MGILPHHRIVLNSSLVIRDPFSLRLKASTNVFRKCKGIDVDNGGVFKTQRSSEEKFIMDRKNYFEASSSSGINILVNMFGYLNAKSEIMAKKAFPSKIDCDKISSVCLNASKDNVNFISSSKAVDIGIEGKDGDSVAKILVNCCGKRPNIKVKFSYDGSFTTIDLLRVKLHELSVLANLKML